MLRERTQKGTLCRISVDLGILSGTRMTRVLTGIHQGCGPSLHVHHQPKDAAIRFDSFSAVVVVLCGYGVQAIYE